MEQKTQLINFWRDYLGLRDAELDAFMDVKREYFIPEDIRDAAYEDKPLPLMRGKTISQPTTVMIMTSALDMKKGDKVFEVGTGSGYQAAIIAKVIGGEGKVISTEIIPELVEFARENLERAGIANVVVFEEDGSKGMEDKAPFDKIIITAACKEFPKELVGQLKPGGIIIGPVGDIHHQEMIKGVKRKDGGLDFEHLGPFLFTPMYGKYGFLE